MHDGYYTYDFDPDLDYRPSTRIAITCPVHGSFNQLVRNHLAGHGCQRCANAQTRRYNRDKCIEKFVKRHGSRYGYDRVCYVDQKTPVVIECKTHGPFEQSPMIHWQGGNCPVCRKETKRQKLTKTTEEFVRGAIIKHGDRYDYSDTIYESCFHRVAIICPIHGQFRQNPSYHLRGGNCPTCSSTRRQSSDLEQLWLDQIGVPLYWRQKRVIFEDQSYLYPDGIDPYKKIIFLFMGDYWHGNPSVYDRDKVNTTVQKTFGELYDKTLEMIEKYKRHGYTVVVQWEKDFVSENFFPVDSLNIARIRDKIPDEHTAYKVLEQIIWNGRPKCPHCGSNRVIPDKTRPGLYCCSSSLKVCHKLFNVRYKLEPFYSSQIPLMKWMHAIYLAFSSRKWLTQQTLCARLKVGRSAAKTMHRAIFTNPEIPILKALKKHLFELIHT